MLLCACVYWHATPYSAFFLIHLDFGSRTFLYMHVCRFSTTLPYSLASHWKLDYFKSKWVWPLSWLLRDPFEDDLENSRQKWFNANSTSEQKYCQWQNIHRNTCKKWYLMMLVRPNLDPEPLKFAIRDIKISTNINKSQKAHC